VSFKKLSFAMSMWVEPVVACYYPGGNRKLSGFNELIIMEKYRPFTLMGKDL
jgi:hypothetical protein